VPGRLLYAFKIKKVLIFLPSVKEVIQAYSRPQ